MCGIVGVVGNKNASALIVDGLKKLEYRGYDSAGIAVLQNVLQGASSMQKKDPKNRTVFKIVKEEGKISNLEKALKSHDLESSIGIGHTRWATHGKPSDVNAHPHASQNICLVHNGIIENYQEIRQKLEKLGVKFVSQTDTEVLPHLIEYHFEKSRDIKKALIASANEIHGTFALAIIFKDEENVIAVAKRGSPLVIGFGQESGKNNGENYIASDYYALAAHTNKIIALQDNEFALVGAMKVEIFDQNAKEIKRSPKLMESQSSAISKEGFDHFMLKEIFEQPRVLEETIQTYVDLGRNSIDLANFAFDLKVINKITIIACGTSYYAALSAKYLIEEIACVEVEVDIASEFRYRAHPFRKDNLMIFVSQSGETADTLAALKYSKENKQKILSIVNVAHSTMAQLSDVVIRTIAGPEIGVASTKAYTAQISVLALLAIHLAFVRGKISVDQKSKLLQELVCSGLKMNEMLSENAVKKVKKIARTLKSAKNLLYIGRGISQITAFEAALKFRELSYVNAQGIAAGELKHGTIALIDKNISTIVVAPRNSKNDLFEKTLSNAQEVNARGGKIIFVSDTQGITNFAKQLCGTAKNKIEIPETEGSIQEALLPIIPLQLLAYFVSLFKGNDVDQPRNLAKSVTVE